MIGLAVALVGRETDDQQAMFGQTGITPLVGFGGLLMMRAIDFQNAPFALILNEEIHFAGLAVGFGIQANFGVSEKEDIFVIEGFGDFDFTLRTHCKSVPCDSAILRLGVLLTFFVGFGRSGGTG